MEFFECVLEALDSGNTSITSIDGAELFGQGGVSTDLLNTQRRERHLCTCLTSGFRISQLNSPKSAVFLYQRLLFLIKWHSDQPALLGIVASNGRETFCLSHDGSMSLKLIKQMVKHCTVVYK